MMRGRTYPYAMSFSKSVQLLLGLALSLVLTGLLTGCYVYVSKFDGKRVRPTKFIAEAERLRAEKRWDESIELYNEHIQWRLGDANRSERENPYFYFIYIGDIYLESERPQEALQTYLDASSKGIADAFIVDRLRQLATWYEERGDYENGISLLSEHREFDPLLFDADIDRLHRSMVLREQEVEDKGF